MEDYQIAITEVAEQHLRALSARERRIVVSGIMARLLQQPTAESKAIKKLRPNPFAEFELRVEQYRVLYNVLESTHLVDIHAVGEKIGNKLFVAGEEFHGHDSNSTA